MARQEFQDNVFSKSLKFRLHWVPFRLSVTIVLGSCSETLQMELSPFNSQDLWLAPGTTNSYSPLPKKCGRWRPNWQLLAAATAAERFSVANFWLPLVCRFNIQRSKRGPNEWVTLFLNYSVGGKVERRGRKISDERPKISIKNYFGNGSWFMSIKNFYLSFRGCGSSREAIELYILLIIFVKCVWVPGFSDARVVVARVSCRGVETGKLPGLCNLETTLAVTVNRTGCFGGVAGVEVRQR